MSKKRANQYIPDYVIPPGETLLEALEERGMTQAELSERTGRKKKTINEIVKGKAPITPETALQLERVLSIPARFWNNLEKNYREDLARIEDEERLSRDVEWLENFPLREIFKKAWVEKAADQVQQVKNMLGFFGVASPEQWQEIWMGEAVAYRKSPSFESNPGALAVWLRKGELVAQQTACAPFDKTAFRTALEEIRTLTTEPPETFQPELARKCAGAGVAVAFVPELPGTHVSGATRWLTSTKALIQLSLRHKSDDHLWFTFFHEAGHILLHGKTDLFIDDETVTGIKEDQANKFAADALIPPSPYRRFKTTLGTRISKKTIRSFSQEIGIAPGILVGRLQHDGLLPQSHCNDLKARFSWKQ
jgi:HTH-type transcriptional regulator/antitoxin HigA